MNLGWVTLLNASDGVTRPVSSISSTQTCSNSVLNVKQHVTSPGTQLATAISTANSKRNEKTETIAVTSYFILVNWWIELELGAQLNWLEFVSTIVD